jgi:putative transposase
MYRLLEQDGATRERRAQLTHPLYQKPELLAAAPNRLWSWDITKLRGPAKWSYFYLYVILDVFSRYVVGWMVAPRESAGLASKLIEETCQKQIILPDQLTIHADRGSSMRGKPVALLLADLGIIKTHSRALHFQRQSVFGKPVPHHEIPPRVSGSLRLDSRCPCFLSHVLSLVQPGPSPFRHRLDDPSHGALRAGSSSS